MAIADTMRQEGLETVLALARQGAYVFPLQAHRKVPFDKFHWKELASNDPAQVEAWAERYPGCNWALYAGKSGHIVLDLDGEAGMRWFADQVVAHGDEWTDTLYAITPGKPGKGPGRHFFYKGVAPSTNGKVAPDVDIKSDLAYVVLAPSIHPDHPNGPPYQWGCDVNQEISNVPAWLLELAQTAARKESENGNGRPVAEPVLADVAITKGNRHKALCSLAGTMRRRGFEGADIEAALASFNARRCVPPKSAEDIHKLAHDIAKRYAPSTQADVLPPPEGWRSRLIWSSGTNSKPPQPLPILENAIIAFRYAPAWQGVLAHNTFSLYTVRLKAAPDGAAGTGNWTDIDDSLAACWLQRNGILVQSKLAAEAVQVVAREHSFHPVQDYVKGLRWDGTERLATWLTTYLGCQDTTFTRAVGRRWLISGVARIFRPGCQCDYTLLLEGPQGKRKSSALRALAGDEWFSDTISDLGSKDARMDLHGVWIIELSELSAARRPEIERVKAFLTCRHDHFRVPYGRRSEDVPRSNVFAGSTNDESPFVDATGNRRFWPVRVGNVDVEGIARDRAALWAEAYHCYQAGEIWWLESDELNALAKVEQDARYEPGVWDGAILDWLHDPHQRCEADGGTSRIEIPVTPWDGSDESRVTIADILVHAVRKPLDRCTQADRNAVARCLTHAGWKMRQDWTRGPARGKRFYYAPEGL